MGKHSNPATRTWSTLGVVAFVSGGIVIVCGARATAYLAAGELCSPRPNHLSRIVSVIQAGSALFECLASLCRLVRARDKQRTVQAMAQYIQAALPNKGLSVPMKHETALHGTRVYNRRRITGARVRCPTTA